MLTHSALQQATQHALGNNQPISTQACAQITTLSIVNATDLSELRFFPALTTLTLLGSNIDCAHLTQLPNLTTCIIRCSKLANTDRLAQLLTVEQLEICFSTLTEAAPLLALPALQTAYLIGNPWHADAYQQLITHQQARLQGAARPIIVISNRKTWQMSLTLQAHGYPAVAGAHYIDGWDNIHFVIPGLPTQTSVAYDLLTFDESELVWLRYPNSTRFQRVYDAAVTAATQSLINFATAPQLGNLQQALAWIATADVAAHIKTYFTAFVQRFPTLTFFRYSPQAVSQRESREALPFPAWYKQLLHTMPFAMPQVALTFYFDEDTKTAYHMLDADRGFSLRLFTSAEGEYEEFGRDDAVIEFGQSFDGDYNLIWLPDVHPQHIYIYDVNTGIGDLFDYFESFEQLIGSIIAIEMTVGEHDLLIRLPAGQ